MFIRSQSQGRRRSYELDDQEILIDFKPAPVSPDARALLNRMSQTGRRFLPLQKTLSDGEIRVERRELIGEAGEPSYPHTCRRNHQDPWGRTVRAPVQFSSTPEDLSLLRVASPQEDHPEEVNACRFSKPWIIVVSLGRTGKGGERNLSSLALLSFLFDLCLSFSLRDRNLNGWLLLLLFVFSKFAQHYIGEVWWKPSNWILGTRFSVALGAQRIMKTARFGARGAF